ncbi:MAG TPA: alcohol dehydrogenase catalytic domain-containing protein, partial [Mucilaginibacter sp.]
MKVPDLMWAMVFEKVGQPLAYKQLPIPKPTKSQVLIKVIACGVCRTDLHIVDGELDRPKLPLVPGHEIIGKIVQA